jgi:predicted amidohydrolase YtcJ
VTKRVDLLLTNANVITMDPGTPTAAAVAVTGEQIAWVGDAGWARDHLPAARREIDLGGATLLPGFIDAHHHLILLGHVGQAVTPRRWCGRFSMIRCWTSWWRGCAPRVRLSGPRGF